MTDVLSKTQRSFNMSMIKAENTGPEIKFRNFLHSRGIRNFKMYPKKISGKPDFYFPEEKLAIFIDGCFWHGCKKCFQKPQTNKKFWMEKVKNNIRRDLKVNSLLSKEGFKVVRLWEHEIKNLGNNRIKKFINQFKKDEVKKLKVLDLFAGAGGFSEGFLATGFDMVGHIEMEKDACETIRTRLIYYSLKKKGRIDDYKKYLLGEISKEEIIEKYNLQKVMDSVIRAKISKDNYKRLIGIIKKRLNGAQLDVIIGGPPCQAYSYIGRARDKNKMRKDHRNYLYKYYVEFLKVLRPQIFVFENVPGLLTAGGGQHLKNMQRSIKKTGYSMDYKLLNATDFGVPQSRKRLILIGWNDKSELKQYPDFEKIKKTYLVKDFLEGLPKIKSGKGVQVVKYKAKSTILEKLGIVDRKLGLLMDHVARSHAKRDLEIFKLAVLSKNQGKNMKYNQLPKKLKSHKNENGFLDRFKVVDALSQDSHTVVAHIAKDGNYYIHPDINQNRSLTIREAARLQTFPDNFKFEGSRTSQFRQIGNAVPPLMSLHIAQKLKRQFNYEKDKI